MEQKTILTAREYSAMQPKKKRAKKEEKIQAAVCGYIKSKYPEVVFFCDLASGMKLPIHIAARHKAMRSSNGIPDLFIAKSCDKFVGIFMELKSSADKALKKNGEIKSDEHVKNQTRVMKKLRDQGYFADFGLGFEDTVKKIDMAMEGKIPENYTLFP